MTTMPGLNSTSVSLENNIQLLNVVIIDPDKINSEVTISNKCLDVGDDSEYDRGPCVRCMELVEKKIGLVYDRIKTTLNRGLKLVILLLYGAYFTYCMYYRFGDEGSIVLLVVTVLLLIYLSKKLLSYRGYSCKMSARFAKCLASDKGRKSRTIMRYVLYLAATAGLCLFLGFDVLKNNPKNSQSLLGIVVLILICLLVSRKPSRINWHPVFWGFILQFLFATLTLRTQFGYSAFKWVGDLVQRLVEFSDAGSAFVLGPNFKSMGLAFGVVGVIVFFNCIISLLTHWGILEVVVIKLGFFIGFCLETGPVESVNAVANIFMGFSEVSLLIRPFLAVLSKSELCAVMTGGFASVAGSVIGIFILFGVPANHLLTAAVISAPAALAMTKIVYPETGTVSLALQSNMRLTDDNDKGRNALSAVADGALMAMKIMVSIVANMLAFVSLLDLMNVMLSWFGQRAGIEGLTFDKICTYVLFPLSYVMGAELEDCGRVGSLIGIKLFATPMVSFAELGKIIQNRRILEGYIASTNGTWHWSGSDIILDSINKTLINGVISERSEAITTYAMCGFSAFTAIGICIGSMTSLCPSRKQDIIELVLIAFFAGNMASFATGAVAGIMYTAHSKQ